MVVEACIGPGYELPVKPFLADAGFVASYRKDCLAIWVEGEEDAPDAIIRVASQLLHVGMPGACERVNMRTTGPRDFPLKQPRLGRDGILESLWTGIDLGLEGARELDDPFNDRQQHNGCAAIKLYSLFRWLPVRSAGSVDCRITTVWRPT